jgi:hypothetical protein
MRIRHVLAMAKLGAFNDSDELLGKVAELHLEAELRRSGKGVF